MIVLDFVGLFSIVKCSDLPENHKNQAFIPALIISLVLFVFVLIKRKSTKVERKIDHVERRNEISESKSKNEGGNKDNLGSKHGKEIEGVQTGYKLDNMKTKQKGKCSESKQNMIAIYGAGSLGTVLGAYLTQVGLPVDLINHNKAHVEALNQYGAQIVGTVNITVPVHALLPEEINSRYDIIFLLTKQLNNPTTIRFLEPFLAPNGVLCTMQNGLPEPGIAEILGKERVMGCTVAWGATLERPGVSTLTSDPSGMSFSLGRTSGIIDEKVLIVKALLESMCTVEIDGNFLGARWSKLLINCGFSGMSAVLGCSFGEAVKNKAARGCLQRIMKECIDVSHADGVRMAPVQGHDVVRLLNYQNPLRKKLSFFLIPMVIRAHRKLKASMLQDLEHGKLTEVDSINGIVSQYGKKHGVPTPYNDKVVEIVHGIEAGTHKCGFQNLILFE